MPRSPIAALIDQACGFEPADLVTMRCPTCGKEKRARRHETDPPKTATVIAPCSDCDAGTTPVRYADAAGRPIDPE